MNECQLWQSLMWMYRVPKVDLYEYINIGEDDKDCWKLCRSDKEVRLF